MKLSSATTPASSAAASARAVENPEASNQQFVTFAIKSEYFALPITTVREIIRLPEVVRVPLSPPTLEGVANLRGRVLPIINLSRKFNLEPHEYNDATRVVVVEQAGFVGFIVDRVASVVTIEPEQLEPIEAIDSTVNSELLTGIIKAVGEHAMVMVLDITRLALTDGLVENVQQQLPSANSFSQSDTVAQVQAVTTDERQLVSFLVAEQEYAFPIDRVQEIVQVPDQISTLPNTQSHVLGVMTLRNRLLPLVSLRQMFGLATRGISAEQRIVVITLDDDKNQRTSPVVGVVMDSVNEVLRVPSQFMDGVPAYLSRNDSLKEIEAICRLNEGKRVVSVISVERLFEHKALRQAIDIQIEAEEENDMQAGEQLATAAQADSEDQFVVFRLRGEEYGVGIEAVQEIIRIPELITRVPKTAQCLEGMVNLRGQVLPVVDLRQRFGLEAMTRDERQRIVVFAYNGLRAGFIVDSVSEVLKISRDTIETVPRLNAEQSQLMGRMANLEKQKRMILILDAEQLLLSQELGELAKSKTETAIIESENVATQNAVAENGAERPKAARRKKQ